MRILTLLLVVLITPGCFLSRTSTHRPLDLEGMAALDPGTTTARQAVELLGAPNEVVQLGRRSAYRYDHGVDKSAGLFLFVVALRGVDSVEDRTWLFFDENETLTHMGSTLQADEARYVIPVIRD